MAYAHIEMMVYRPFLHYISFDIQVKNLDKRSYACAAACVSVSRNIVHLTGEMKRKGLLIGSYWFYMYTTFSAVISLVFFVLENPQSETSAAILRDAHEGRDTLAGLAKRSLAADRCSRHLAVRIIKHYHEPATDNLRNSSSSSPNVLRAPALIRYLKNDANHRRLRLPPLQQPSLTWFNLRQTCAGSNHPIRILHEPKPRPLRVPGSRPRACSTSIHNASTLHSTTPPSMLMIPTIRVVQAAQS